MVALKRELLMLYTERARLQEKVQHEDRQQGVIVPIVEEEEEKTVGGTCRKRWKTKNKRSPG